MFSIICYIKIFHNLSIVIYVILELTQKYYLQDIVKQRNIINKLKDN